MYKLPTVLKNRLLDYEFTEESINESIKKYKQETRDYLSLVLLDFSKITQAQLEILEDIYIQYKLFSVVEAEALVEDKKQALDEMIALINNQIEYAHDREDVNSTHHFGKIMVFNND